MTDRNVPLLPLPSSKEERPVDPVVLRAFMEYWDQLARGDRDVLKEHFPNDEHQIGYYAGYATAARDVLSYLKQGRFAVGAKPPKAKP